MGVEGAGAESESDDLFALLARILHLSAQRLRSQVRRSQTRNHQLKHKHSIENSQLLSSYYRSTILITQERWCQFEVQKAQGLLKTNLFRKKAIRSY